MQSIDVRLADGDWKRLRDHCKTSFRAGCCPETGAIGLLGECRTERRYQLLVARILWPHGNDLKTASHGELVFDASYIRRAHLEMRRCNLAGLIMFHTHPLSDSHVGFSAYDDAQEPTLAENLIELHSSTNLASIVLGRTSQCGRIWLPNGGVLPLRELTLVGDRLSYLPLNGEPQPPPPPPEAMFDRAMLLTSAGALNRLSKMTIAVVGASGTGSLICHLLANAGCKRLIVFDPDIMEEVNRPRVLLHRPEDVLRATPKVEIARRGNQAIGCHIEALQENILARESIARLRDADAVICCVDNAFPRQLLSKYAYQFLTPLIDVGSEIAGNSAGIVSLDSRATYVAPPRPCLQCLGVVTPRQLSFETLSFEERERVRAQGYSSDLLLSQPAVMDLNISAAHLGMMFLRHLLQPFLLEPLPYSITDNIVTYSRRAIRTARADNPRCPICHANSSQGFGDCGPNIGLDHEALSRLVPPAARSCA